MRPGDGMKRPLFNWTAAGSLLLCVGTACAWYSAVRSHVSEGDRIEQRGREINEAINRATWNSPAYREWLKAYEAWTAIRDEYRRREPQVLAADHLRYVVLPRALVVTLALAPTIWLVLFWRRYERRWAHRAFDPLTRGQRVRRGLFTTAAAVSFTLSLAVAASWVRSYYVTDSFFLQGFFNEGDRTFWRQTSLRSGRGSVALNVHVSSGQRGVFQRVVQDALALYAKRRGTSSPPQPPSFHSTYPSRDVYADLGPEQRRWGFGWGHFERGRTASRPEYYGYTFVPPFWSLGIISLAVPLLWSWRRVRRRWLVRPGHCRCGYNLTGNTSGICPECGTAFGIGGPE